MGMLDGAPHWVVIALFVVPTGHHRHGRRGSVLRWARRSGGAGSWCPNWRRCCRSPALALVSGLIWAAWHYPITSVVYRDAGLPSSFWLLTFTFVAVAISFAQAWLRLRTDSLWPPIFLHAKPQPVDAVDLLPADERARAYTKWVAGDLGLAFVVVAAVVAAAFFWVKRRRLARSSVEAQRA